MFFLEIDLFDDTSFFEPGLFLFSWPVLYKIQSSIMARTSPKVLRHYYVLPTCSGVGELT